MTAIIIDVAQTVRAWGWVALSLCTTAHPLHTRFANIFGTSVSEATMRPDPRRGLGIDAGKEGEAAKLEASKAEKAKQAEQTA